MICFAIVDTSKGFFAKCCLGRGHKWAQQPDTASMNKTQLFRHFVKTKLFLWLEAVFGVAVAVIAFLALSDLQGYECGALDGDAPTATAVNVSEDAPMLGALLGGGDDWLVCAQTPISTKSGTVTTSSQVVEMCCKKPSFGNGPAWLVASALLASFTIIHGVYRLWSMRAFAKAVLANPELLINGRMTTSDATETKATTDKSNGKGGKGKKKGMKDAADVQRDVEMGHTTTSENDVAADEIDDGDGYNTGDDDGYNTGDGGGSSSDDDAPLAVHIMKGGKEAAALAEAEVAKMKQKATEAKEKMLNTPIGKALGNGKGKKGKGNGKR
jgi:hypothetical protein